MFDLYNNIKDIAAEHGYTPSGLMVAMGKPKSVLSNLNSGISKSLNGETMQQIADFLNEPYDRIAHGANYAEQLFEKHHVLMDRVGRIEDKMSDEDKKIIEGILDVLDGKYAD